MAPAGQRVLVVEDETSQLELLAYNLEVEGYEVFRATSAEEGLLVLRETEIDLILLDWMLPQTSGLEFCRQVRRSKDWSAIPIIMLTARGEEEDKIRGLDTGADDYLVKPYSVRELMARVRAALRKRDGQTGGEVLEFEGLTMDLAQHKVSVSGTPVSLGPLEFRLLRAMMERPGRVWSREQLLDRVWGNNLNVETRTVDVHIGRLRKQIGKASDREFIRTVRGFGYALDTSG